MRAERIFWNKLKAKLVKMHPTLTKSDLIWRDGTISDMLEMISSKLGITAEELMEDVDKL
jgi:hypothetical protein